MTKTRTVREIRPVAGYRISKARDEDGAREICEGKILDLVRCRCGWGANKVSARMIGEAKLAPAPARTPG